MKKIQIITFISTLLALVNISAQSPYPATGMQAPTTQGTAPNTAPLKSTEPQVFFSKESPPTTRNPGDEVEKVIYDQLKSLAQGDATLAYYAFTSTEFQKAVTLATFNQFLALNKILAMRPHVVLEEPTFSGSTAKVKGRLSTNNGTSQVEYELVQENGTWKIYRFEIFNQPRQ